MHATQIVLLGGLKLDEAQRTLSAADRITALALLDERGALPLGGCVLFVELAAVDATTKEQAVRIALQGPPGTLGLMNGQLAFAAAEDGLRKATVLLNLDGVGVKEPGRYAFRVFDGSDELGSLELTATVARGRARVRLGTFIDRQLPFTLFAEDGAFGGYSVVGVEPGPDGVQPTLTLPSGYEKLGRVAAFVAAVQRASAGDVEAGDADVVVELPA
jgi:hypothetical protein